MAISASQLRKLLDYDPKTGRFTWRVNKPKSRGARKGATAGCVSDTDGYRYIKINQTPYTAGRLAFLWMTGRLPPQFVDHANCVRDDNRWSNLRFADASQNSANSTPRTKRKYTLPKGVTWHKRDQFYVAQFRNQFLGYFNRAEDAHAAYVAEAEKNFGEYARTK